MNKLMLLNMNSASSESSESSGLCSVSLESSGSPRAISVGPWGLRASSGLSGPAGPAGPDHFSRAGYETADEL